MFKVDNKSASLKTFWVLFCLLWTYFTPVSSVSIVDFEQVNVSWVDLIIITIHLTIWKHRLHSKLTIKTLEWCQNTFYCVLCASVSSLNMKSTLIYWVFISFRCLLAQWNDSTFLRTEKLYHYQSFII